MGKKMNSAPVYYTVAQVQFNPILNLDSYLPAIQSQMRDANFPDYKREVFQQLILPFGAGDAGQSAAPTLASQSRYTFGDMAGETSFLLESNGLSVQTTAYDTYEIFSATLLKGLGIVHEALRLNFIERIGLRYLDAIQPVNDNESLDKYLVPEVLGLSGKIDGELVQSVSETSSMTKAGHLIARIIVRNGQIGLPVELSTLVPKIAPRFTQRDGLHAILDTDASYAVRETFDLSKIENRLSELHEEIKKSFSATVTPHALAVWD